MKTKKLLFYINSINHGGAERMMLQLAEQFGRAGNSVILVTSFEDQNAYPVPDVIRRITTNEAENHRNRWTKTIARIKALRKVCKQEKPDAVISFMAEPNMRAILATRGLGIKTIVSVRNDPKKEYAGTVGKIIRKFILPHADGCVFQTEQAQAEFPWSTKKKTVVIYNAVTELFFSAIYAGGEDIVTVGRLTAQKNQEMLIRAYAALKNNHGANLRIYGVGDLQEHLQEVIHELHLQDKVFLMGSTQHVDEVLSHARMFVLPSDYEGMPNCLMEAMTVGVPCISTDCPCGGPVTLMKDGKEGLLIRVGDTNGLTEAMQRLLDDEAYAQQLGRSAADKAKSFRWGVIYQQWEAYVESLID